MKKNKGKINIYKQLRYKYMKEKTDILKQHKGKFVVYSNNGVIYNSNNYLDAKTFQENNTPSLLERIEEYKIDSEE